MKPGTLPTGWTNNRSSRRSESKKSKNRTNTLKPSTIAFLLPLALTIASGLAVAPGLGQQKAAIQKTHSQKAGNKPTLNVALSPGHKFDQKTAAALLSAGKSANSWVKIPADFAYKWKTTSLTQTACRYEKTGTEDSTNTVLKLRKAVIVIGTMKDARGDIWQFNAHGTWPNNGIFTEESFETGPDGGLCRNSRVISFEIDEQSNEITKCSQLIGKATFRLVAAGGMKQETTTTLYDWKGASISTVKSEAIYRRTGMFSPRKAVDGKPLFPMFVQFLKEHKMADRIPAEPTDG